MAEGMPTIGEYVVEAEVSEAGSSALISEVKILQGSWSFLAFTSEERCSVEVNGVLGEWCSEYRRFVMQLKWLSEIRRMCMFWWVILC